MKNSCLLKKGKYLLALLIYLLLLIVIMNVCFYIGSGLDIPTTSYLCNINNPLIMLSSIGVFFSLPLLLVKSKLLKLLSIGYFILSLINYYILGSFYPNVYNVTKYILELIDMKKNFYIHRVVW